MSKAQFSSSGREPDASPGPFDLIVLTVGRTGSNYLQELMASNGLGNPNEHFHQDFGFGDAVRAGSSTEAYLDRMRVEKTAGGVFGVKVMATHLEPMARSMSSGSVSPDDVLFALFPRGRYVWLRRREKIRQAISLWRAFTTGQFIRLRGEAAESQSPGVLDPIELDRYVRYIVEGEAVWARFLERHGITPLELYYEDLIADPAGRMRELLTHIGVAVPNPLSIETRCVRQADRLTETFVTEYLQARPAYRKLAPTAIALPPRSGPPDNHGNTASRVPEPQVHPHVASLKRTR